ncbi:hypothetical protein [Enterovibrio coralii]|uniref:Uncharacterized protein n=1 Tax=Enterovibrio coralii TaxID=294935 RepID=A0A135I8R0_9GAMM|nr:hypothetical protein [Enterovibrio coralii]KXF81831.1 hypothetical protein ATN88_20230 [Enterovibrio coralii]
MRNFLKSKMIAYTIFLLVVTLHTLSYCKYEALEEQALREQKAAFSDYFVGDDERLKLVWFSNEDNTISIALAISGLGDKPQELDRLRDNAKRFVFEKVCNSPALVDYLDQGNYISVDIRNDDSSSYGVNHITNVMMSANRCR